MKNRTQEKVMQKIKARLENLEQHKVVFFFVGSLRTHPFTNIINFA